MNKLITLSLIIVFWIFPNIGKAQLLGFDSTSTNMGSLPDTINLNDNYVHTLTVHNFDSVDFTGTIYLVAAIDSSGTLLSVDTVGSVFVSNLGWTDTVSITYTEAYNTLNGYKLGDNIVVVWPVAGTTAIRDSIRQNVYIDNPASIQTLNNANKDVLIYPNPFLNHFVVKNFNWKNELKQVRIFNSEGKLILQQMNLNFTNLEYLTKGMYFIYIDHPDGNQSHFKIIKN